MPDAATALRLREALADSSVKLEVSDLIRARKNAPNGLRRWLDELGLWGSAARDKFVPDAVFRCPREELVLFLNRLFATDGWATVLASGQAQLGYCTVSERLARQVQHLLLRFGVVATLCKRSVKYEEVSAPGLPAKHYGAEVHSYVRRGDRDLRQKSGRRACWALARRQAPTRTGT